MTVHPFILYSRRPLPPKFFPFYLGKAGLQKRVFGLLLLYFLFTIPAVFGQSGMIGDGFGSGWTNPANVLGFSASANGSQILTRNASGTGNRYFRLTRNNGVEMSPSGSCTPGNDVDITASSSGAIFIANTGNCGNGAWYINAGNTTDNYVFKLPFADAGTSFLYFRIQGAIRTVNTVTQSPLSTAVFPGQDVTVTATLNGAFSTGQMAYLRYSTDNWVSSAVVTMTGSGTTYTGTIPGTAQIASATIRYYVFTSGPNNVQSDGSNADYFTINLNNNGGPNYSYTVISGWASASDGNWSSPSTWAANAVPPTSGNLGTVQISNNVTLNQNATVGTLNVNSGTLTLSGNNTLSVTGTATIANGATIDNSSSIASNISISALTVNNGGTYLHNTVGSSANGASTDFPGTTRTFGASSNVTIKKWANGGNTPAALPASGNPGWGNLTIDVASLGGNWVQSGLLTRIQGDFTVNATGSYYFGLLKNTSGTTTINGNTWLTGGVLTMLVSGSFSGNTAILTINGNLSMSNNGKLSLTPSGFSISFSKVQVFLKGNLTVTNSAQILQPTVGWVEPSFVFNKASGNQTFASHSTGLIDAVVGWGIGDITNNGGCTNTLTLLTDFVPSDLASVFRIYKNATLECPGETNVFGAGAAFVTDGGPVGFTLYAGGYLKIGSASGISAEGVYAGNIRTTGVRNFDQAAHYIYNGTYNQVTGNGLPATITGSLTVDNSGSAANNIVTLTTNNTETKSLYLKQGYFAAGTNQTLKISNTGIVDGTGGGDCIYLTANGGNIHLLGNNTVTGASTGHPYFYDVTLGSGIASSPSSFTNNGTIYHYCTINSQGSVNPDAPTYATGSTLIYNPAGTYNRSIEWGQATAGAPGYPWHVIVQNGTTLNLGNATPPLLECGGNMTIGIAGGGAGIANMNALAQPLIVKGHLTIGDSTSAGSPTGTLNLSSAVGGDLWLHGNFTRGKNSTYTDNNRAIYFKGSANATVNTPGIAITPGVPSQYFSYARVDKNTGTEQVTLNCPVGITQEISFIKGIVNSSDDNLLVVTNTNAAAVVGGSSLSYVNGPLNRYTNTSVPGAYAFPLGKTVASTPYRPLTLTTVASLASGSNFTGEYFFAAAPIAGSDAFLHNLYGIVNKEYWQLDRNNGSTTGTVTLPYNDPGVGKWREAGGGIVYPCATCRVAVVKRSNTYGAGTWDFSALTGLLSNAGTPPEYMAYTSSGDIISKEFTSFSPLTIGFYYDLVLPVQLLQFKASLVNQDGRLEWQVADSRDLAGFELEHSMDGRNFSRISAINGSAATQYSYLDPKLATGNHYYRLLVREGSGRQFYSNVQVLRVGKAGTQIVGIRQNPVRNSLDIMLYSAGQQAFNALVTDAVGRQVLRAKKVLADGMSYWQIPVANLAKGVYFIRIAAADGETGTLRFVKE